MRHYTSVLYLYLILPEIPDFYDSIVSTGCDEVLFLAVPADDVDIAVVRVGDRYFTRGAWRTADVPDPEGLVHRARTEHLRQMTSATSVGFFHLLSNTVVFKWGSVEPNGSKSTSQGLRRWPVKKKIKIMAEIVEKHSPKGVTI